MALLSEGQTIAGTYTVERYLGEGAFAEVYRVRHRFLGRQAMKVFKNIGMSMPETEELLQEAVILSQIGHPNIVRVFDANVTETSKGLCGFFTMEYVAGGSLESFWKSFGIQLMPVETAVEIVRQACRGIAVAHSEKPPIVHRDIKPQNVLVGYDADGIRVRVSDFGLAKRANPLTLMVSARGTRCFKAPETFRNLQADSRAGDVWALGCTLYLLLTDRFPFTDPGETGLIDDCTFDRPLILPSQLNVMAGPAVDQIIVRALANRPEDRYPSAKELLADLEKWRPLPKGAKASVKSVPTGATKSALGEVSSLNKAKAQKMVDQAILLANHPQKLSEAADLMEEAFNKWPELRDEYEYQVKLWRRGIIS
jgi:serine/threonine protein kinase